MTTPTLGSRNVSRPLRTVTPRELRAWEAIQLAGILATVALFAGLWLRPDPTLHILWDMVIPLLPAVFLANPMIWRNACPVATLNAFAAARSRGKRRAGPGLRTAWAVGVGLLLVLVPARHVLFNENGAALALLVGGLAFIGIVSGLLYERRAGFCSAMCPVLPVEKLYGQAPLLRVGSARCGDCSLCVSAGCPDMAQGKAAAQSVTARAHWMLTPYGAFAAMFPGFVAGYFTVEAFPVNPYLHVALAATGSWVMVSLIADALRFGGRDALPILGALSFATYYWFAAPKLAVAYGVTDAGVALRWLSVAVAALWLRRALSGRRLERVRDGASYGFAAG
ncbi:MAG: hypothetical protein ACM357_05815 [Gemmatimonadota bacterium]